MPKKLNMFVAHSGRYPVFTLFDDHSGGVSADFTREEIARILLAEEEFDACQRLMFERVSN